MEEEDYVFEYEKGLVNFGKPEKNEVLGLVSYVHPEDNVSRVVFCTRIGDFYLVNSETFKVENRYSINAETYCLCFYRNNGRIVYPSLLFSSHQFGHISLWDPVSLTVVTKISLSQFWHIWKIQTIDDGDLRIVRFACGSWTCGRVSLCSFNIFDDFDFNKSTEFRDMNLTADYCNQKLIYRNPFRIGNICSILQLKTKRDIIAVSVSTPFIILLLSWKEQRVIQEIKAPNKTCFRSLESTVDDRTGIEYLLCPNERGGIWLYSMIDGCLSRKLEYGNDGGYGRQFFRPISKINNDLFMIGSGCRPIKDELEIILLKISHRNDDDLHQNQNIIYMQRIVRNFRLTGSHRRFIGYEMTWLDNISGRFILGSNSGSIMFLRLKDGEEKRKDGSDLFKIFESNDLKERLNFLFFGELTEDWTDFHVNIIWNSTNISTFKLFFLL